jgi:hypothetical protein
MHTLYGLTAAALRTPTLLLLFLLLSLLSSQAFASDNQHMVPLTLTERVKEANLVVEGEVVSQRSFWDARQQNIYTSNIIRIYKSFKGNTESREVELITEGGTIGLKKHVYSTALHLKPGQQGVFFLQRQQQLQRTPGSQHISTKAYGSQQGFVKYDVRRNKASGVFDRYESVQQLYQSVAKQTGQQYRTISRNEALEAQPAVELKQQKTQNAAFAPVISSFAPRVASAGSGAVLTINGSGFGNTRGEGAVEFANADDGGQTYVQPLAPEYISWTNTQIKLYIPSTSPDGGTPGSGPIRVVTNDGSTTTSSTDITIEYAYSNIEFGNTPFRPIMIDKNGLGGYSIQFAPSMQNRQPAQEGFRRAMNSWICVSEVNWRIGEPTDIDEAAEDEVNVIRFAPTTTTGAGVLARTISRYEGCRSGQDTLFWVSEFDMEINSNITWQYGPGAPVNRQFDFETVMLHELGHAQQLGHVILNSAIMHYEIEFERLIRDLSSADIRGARNVVENSTGENICQEPPMQLSTENECDLAPEIYTLQAAFTSPNAVTVDWRTVDEQGVESFVVQRSANFTDWEDLGSVDAVGPGDGPNLDYTFVDNAPVQDISYYRLRVVYNDGTSSFSPRVRAINPASLRRLSVYPNPISEEDNTVTLVYIVEGTATLEAQLYDMSGKLVRGYDITFRDANLPAQLDVSGLASGIYILKWQERDKTGQVKLLKR